VVGCGHEILILTFTLFDRKYKLLFVLLIERVDRKFQYIVSTFHNFIDIASLCIYHNIPFASNSIVLYFLFNVFTLTQHLLSCVHTSRSFGPNYLPHISRKYEHRLSRVPIAIHESIKRDLVVNTFYFIDSQQRLFKGFLQIINI